MNSKKDPNDEISRAMEKLDLDAARIQEQKAFYKKKLKPKKVKKVVSRQEVIKNLNDENTKKVFDSIKMKTIILILIFFTVLKLTWNYTRLERATLVENIAMAVLFLGIVGAAAAKGR